MNIDKLKFRNTAREVASDYYLKVRIKGVEDYSDIYGETQDNYIELPNCSSMNAASNLAKKIIDEFSITLSDVGNDIVAYMVAKMH